MTGAFSGIGAARSRRFVEEGAVGALFVRREGTPAQGRGGARRRCRPDCRRRRRSPRRWRAPSVNHKLLSDRSMCSSTAAAILGPRSLRKFDAESWRRTIHVNLSDSFYVAREVALSMLEGAGPDITTSARTNCSWALRATPPTPPRRAGSSARRAALAAEPGRSISVKAICRGLVETPMVDVELQWLGDAAGRCGP